MKKPYPFLRRRPDFLLEELLAALSAKTWFEFKPPFLIVHEKLRERHAVGGGQEMLRPRTYEKLQNLVQTGGVEKKGKSYRGIPSGMAAITEHLAAEHCRALLATARGAAPHAIN